MWGREKKSAVVLCYKKIIQIFPLKLSMIRVFPLKIQIKNVNFIECMNCSLFYDTYGIRVNLYLPDANASIALAQIRNQFHHLRNDQFNKISVLYFFYSFFQFFFALFIRQRSKFLFKNRTNLLCLVLYLDTQVVFSHGLLPSKIDRVHDVPKIMCYSNTNRVIFID